MNAPAIQPRTRQQWADAINTEWRKSIEGIIHTGAELRAAKAELPHGEFGRMVRDDLPFSADTAESLMKIAGDPRIAESETFRNSLPLSWGALMQLTRLSDEDFEAGARSGVINPKMSVRTAQALVGTTKTPKGQAWGEGRRADTLPTPADARKVAKATGRLVAASDGRMYTGASEEEAADSQRRRTQTLEVRDAIELLADFDADPALWLQEADDHLLYKFRIGCIGAAIDWLRELEPLIADRLGVHDA